MTTDVFPGRRGSRMACGIERTGISRGCPQFERFDVTLKQEDRRGGSEMRQMGRLACLAAAGLFVVTALEAQKAPAPKVAPVAKPAAAAKAAAAPKIEISPETKD